MAGANEATFFFNTNIEEVIGKITAALAELQAKTKDAGRGSKIDLGITDQTSQATQRAIEDLGRLNKAAKDASLSAKDLNEGYRGVLTRLDRDLGTIVGANGLKLEVGLELRKTAIGEIKALVNRELGAAVTAISPEFGAELQKQRLQAFNVQSFNSARQKAADSVNTLAPLKIASTPETRGNLTGAANRDQQAALQAQRIASQTYLQGERLSAAAAAADTRERIATAANISRENVANSSRELEETRAANKAAADARRAAQLEQINGYKQEALNTKERIAQATAASREAVANSRTQLETTRAANKAEADARALAATERRAALNAEALDIRARIAGINAGAKDNASAARVETANIVEAGRQRADAARAQLAETKHANSLQITESKTANRLIETEARTSSAERIAAARAAATIQGAQARATATQETIAAREASTIRVTAFKQGIRDQAAIDTQTRREQYAASTLAAAEQRRASREATRTQERLALANLFVGPNELRPGVTALGNGYFKDISDGTERYFRKISDGLRELTTLADKQIAEAQKFIGRGIPIAGGAAGGGGDGIIDSFFKGAFSGGLGGQGKSGLNGLAQSAGTTVKYTGLYAVLGLLQQGFAQATDEVLNFEDSQTNLEIALENTSGATEESAKINNDFADSLQAIASDAGVNVGDVMDVAASGIRSVGQEAGQTTEEVKGLSVAFAKQTQVQSILAKTTLADAFGNLKAITSAFNLPLQAAARVNDAIVLAKNVGGGDEKQTAQALASFGVAAAQAGFNLEQAATLASRVQQATDESGSAVGNRLARITSIASGEAGQKAIAQINGQLGGDAIDTNGSVYEQLLQLSKIYPTLTEAQRKSLINTVGGTTATREFITTLTDLYPLVDNNGKGLNSAGAAANEYQRRLHDLTVELRHLQGAAREIVTNIGQSNILDPLFAGFKLFATAVESIAALTGAFKNLNDDVRKFVVYTVEAALALKALAAIRNGSSFLAPLLGGGRAAVAAPAAVGVTSAAASAAATSGVAAKVTTQLVSQAGVATAETQAIVRKLAITGRQIAETEGRLMISLATNATAAEEAQTAFYLQQRAFLVQQQAALQAQLVASTGGAAGLARRRAGDALLYAGSSPLKGGVTQTVGGTGKLALNAERQAANSALVGQSLAGQAKLVSSGTVAQAGLLASTKALKDRTEALAGKTKLTATAFSGIAGLARLLFNPFTLLIAAVLGAGYVFSNVKKINESLKAADNSLTDLAKVNGLAADQQADAYKNIAAEAATSLSDIKSATKGLGGFLGKIFSEDPSSTLDTLRSVQKYASDQANAVQADQDRLAKGLNAITVFGDPAGFTAQSLAAKLQTLSDSGLSAAQRMDLLTRALNLTGDAASGSESKIGQPIDRDQVARGVTQELADQGAKFANPKLTKTFGLAAGNPIGGDVGKLMEDYSRKSQTVNDGTNPLASIFSQNLNAVVDEIAKALPTKSSTSTGFLSATELAKVEAPVIKRLVDDYTKKYNAATKSVQAQNKTPTEFNAFLKTLLDSIFQGKNLTSTADPSKTYTAQEIGDIYTQDLAPTAEQQIGELAPGDVRGKAKVNIALANNLNALIKKAKPRENLEKFINERNKLYADAAADLVADDEKLRKVEQANAKTQAEFDKIGKDYFKKEVLNAARSGNIDLLINVLSQATASEIALAGKIIDDQLAIDKAKLDGDKAKARAFAIAQAAITGDSSPEAFQRNYDQYFSDKGYKGDQDKVDSDERAKKAFGAAKRRTVPADESGYTSSVEPVTPLDKANLAIAKRNANALDDAGLDKAERDVKDAQQRFNTYRKKDEAYYGALKDLNDKKRALADYEATTSKDLQDQLSIDLTNPLQTATAEHDKAVRNLARARQRANEANGGKGLQGKEREDYLAQYILEERSTRVEQENQANSMFLDNLNTAESLGRISHAKYLEYVKAEIARTEAKLKGMKDTDAGYYQTTQYLNTLYGDLKSGTDSLNELFNIGDIKVPTPYEVRRMIKSSDLGGFLKANAASSTAGNVTTDSSTKNVILNGIPISQVITIIQDLFGVKARSNVSKKVV